MFSNILYNLFIGPLELIFEILYFYGSKVSPIVGILLISIVMNFLALPLYMRADAIQEEERQKVSSMSKWIEHIKKTFKGDERYMMLTHYYKLENYKPIYGLRSTFSLLLQIPFFIAAYHFLSNLPALNGETFWIIKDLGAQDGLLHFGSLNINLLPILMTAINVISAYIYLKGFPVKDKIQTYGIALIFLILLYDRPAGLVLYWTLNQVFSALKNVFLKVVKDRKAKDIFFSIAGILIIISAILLGYITSIIRAALVGVIFVIFQMPLIVSMIKKKYDFTQLKKLPSSLFVLSSLIVIIFAGTTIPLSVLSASPEEFLAGSNTLSAIVIHTFSLSLGLFGVWFGVYYYMSNNVFKNIFTYVMSFVAVMSLVNFNCFNKNFGSLNTELGFTFPTKFTNSEIFLNMAVLILIAIGLVFIVKYFKKLLPYIYSVAIIGVLGLSVINMVKTANGIKDITIDKEVQTDKFKEEKILNLSTNGKNVIVFMLDRAVNGFVPYMLEEKPELAAQFDGFVYYPNTLSYGNCTNFAAPALFGGYEYRPRDINARADELLKDKHDEALKVMPKLFSDNGYNVTVCDPPYAGYEEIPDLSIYDDIQGVKAYVTAGKYNDVVGGGDAEEIEEFIQKTQLRNFFMYSIYHISPNCVKSFIYYDGKYLNPTSLAVSKSFLNQFGVLANMTNMVDIKEDNSNNLLVIQNSTTHEQTLGLKAPNYYPYSGTDTCSGDVYANDSTMQIGHYNVNMASFIQLGRWFDYLRENDLYDNTRIILVSDHAFNIKFIHELMLSNGYNFEAYNPLLMVKDFNATGFTTSNQFMTNADVPTLATEGVIERPVNPYTGNKINSGPKKEKQVITTSTIHNISENNGNVFDSSDGEWWSVGDNIFDENNWSFVGAGGKE